MLTVSCNHVLKDAWLSKDITEQSFIVFQNVMFSPVCIWEHISVSTIQHIDIRYSGLMF